MLPESPEVAHAGPLTLHADGTLTLRIPVGRVDTHAPDDAILEHGMHAALEDLADLRADWSELREYDGARLDAEADAHYRAATFPRER